MHTPRQPVSKSRRTRRIALVLAAAVGVSVPVAVLWRMGGDQSLAATTAPTTSTTSGASAPAPTTSATQPQPSQRDAALTTKLENLAGSTEADFALAVTDHRTGRTYTYNAQEEFETASVVKMEILAATLLKNDGKLTDEQRNLADVMIRQSDNAAASALWKEIGYSDGLDKASEKFGLTGTKPDDGGSWGLTTTTVTDQAALVDAIVDDEGPLGDANDTVTDLMGSVVDNQDWGISAAAGPTDKVILKNGWMPWSADGNWTVNSVGRITGTDTDVTIAVLSRGSDSEAAGIHLIEDVVTMASSTLRF